MASRPLQEQLAEIHELIVGLSERVRQLEQPTGLPQVKPCNHFGDLVTAIEAIKRIAEVCQHPDYAPSGKELTAIHRIASAVLLAKQGTNCSRWRLFFDPEAT